MTSGDVVDRFLLQAAVRPAHPAVATADGTVSFGELESRVRRFAAAFAICPQPRVLIALPQCADAYAAMLAAGLGGGYYVPLNLSAPLEKLCRIARLVEPDVIIAADAPLAAALAAQSPRSRLLDPAAAVASAPVEGRGERHRLAYVIFTSGSTGMPKGVMIPRQGLDHYIAWATEALRLGPSAKISQHPNIGFDFSVLEIYAALAAGATLCPVASQGERLMPAQLIERMGITVWVSVPSVVSLMMRAHHVTAANLHTVRCFVFCGEPLLREHLAAIFAARPDAEVLNLYGPTEATVSMTSLRLNAENYEDACATSVAIGDPIPGMGLGLVGGDDPHEGEIVITGPQLAEGYWQDPQQTSHAFRPVSIDRAPPVRGYFTGDWAQRRGRHVFFKERLDFQVKIQGFRLELDEVAAAIRDCGWPAVCVLKWNDSLAAVIEHDDRQGFDEAALRAALAEKVEPHAVPKIIRVIARLPRNDNDKLDRAAVAAWLEGAGTGVPAAT